VRSAAAPKIRTSSQGDGEGPGRGQRAAPTAPGTDCARCSHPASRVPPGSRTGGRKRSMQTRAGSGRCCQSGGRQPSASIPGRQRAAGSQRQNLGAPRRHAVQSARGTAGGEQEKRDLCHGQAVRAFASFGMARVLPARSCGAPAAPVVRRPCAIESPRAPRPPLPGCRRSRAVSDRERRGRRSPSEAGAAIRGPLRGESCTIDHLWIRK